MVFSVLFDTFGYTDSPNFLRNGTRAFDTTARVDHNFRSAAKSNCGLIGVYTHNDVENPVAKTCPVAYVFRAKTEQAADQVHRLVWNQYFVAFMIV